MVTRPHASRQSRQAPPQAFGGGAIYFLMTRRRVCGGEPYACSPHEFLRSHCNLFGMQRPSALRGPPRRKSPWRQRRRGQARQAALGQRFRARAAQSGARRGYCRIRLSFGKRSMMRRSIRARQVASRAAASARRLRARRTSGSNLSGLRARAFAAHGALRRRSHFGGCSRATPRTLASGQSLTTAGKRECKGHCLRRPAVCVPPVFI